jgi:hypothetical protein
MICVQGLSMAVHRSATAAPADEAAGGGLVSGPEVARWQPMAAKA